MPLDDAIGHIGICLMARRDELGQIVTKGSLPVSRDDHIVSSRLQGSERAAQSSLS